MPIRLQPPATGDVRRGVLVVIGYGAFADRAEWDAATEWSSTSPGRRRLSSGVRDDRLARLGSGAAPLAVDLAVPDRVVELTDPRRSTTSAAVRRQAPGADRRVRTTLVDGLVVTALADTVVDVVLRHDRERALAVADAAVDVGAPVGPVRARAGARAVRAFRAGEPGARSRRRTLRVTGESRRSGGARRGGGADVVLQHEFRDDDGTIGFVDFWFPDQGVVLEFDGRVKYRDHARRGMTAADVLVAEKQREDRLRRHPDVRGSSARSRDDDPGGCASRPCWTTRRVCRSAAGSWRRPRGDRSEP